ncbi:J domain-containing protein [Erythrobacter insulae]|uniref:J domain-containing protein n=1 Tax=Erythrobacter insulae TaxID=2584124 RepID=A0A547PBR1_9SPHN|nr:J domain-containing protein [Erythrobacter insulae]TRD11474.1 J domain-containing protein [Erythrobacter insulae]
MLRIVIILAIICILFRWAFGKWPWQGLRLGQGLGQGGKATRGQAAVQARKLLGVEHGAGRDEILAAHKRLIAMVHPDKGGSNAAVHEANDARDLLLSELPDRRTDIDHDE